MIIIVVCKYMYIVCNYCIYVCVVVVDISSNFECNIFFE